MHTPTPAPPAASRPPGEPIADTTQAAVGPSPDAVSAAENLLPAGRADTAAEARGRRILSTAFVQIGPGGTLMVEQHGGATLVLRDVVMRPHDYCGVQAGGGKVCGGYADVAAARVGSAAGPQPVDARANPAPGH